MSRAAAFAAGALAMVLVAGCGENRQVVQYEKGKYQGRADAKPWDNAPNAWSASTWKQGDRTSWEAALRQRNQGQNEYTRSTN